MANALSISKAKKSIGSRELFGDLSFGLDLGARVAIVGPNGAGKSTLLRCLSGTEKIDSGAMVWNANTTRYYVSQSPNINLQEAQVLSLWDYFRRAAPKDEQEHFETSESSMRLWELISKINFGESDLSKTCASLSGGGMKKAQIIQALLQKPDFLLMDEPTNHLDVDGIMWLESFLRDQRDLGLVLVSHDRLFLQNTVDEIIEINPTFRDGHLRSRGGYVEYIEARTEYLRAQKVIQQRKENDMRKELTWLRRGAIARLKKQQARQNSAAELISEVDELRSLNRSRQIDMEMKTSGRSPKKLVEFENVTMSRGDRTLISNLNLLIHKNTRLGLLGSNGSGKSTLINQIVAAAQKNLPEKLKQTVKVDSSLSVKGKISCYDDIQINYFDQSREQLQSEKSVLKNICPEGDYVHVAGSPVFARSYLDRFGFRRDQHDLKVRELSGGEQNRLVLAKLMTKQSQLMILDEPTNDLDFEMLNSLRDTLDQFDGAIILVTHDRAFMDEVCNEILYFSEELQNFELVKFSSFLQWQDWKIETQAKKNSETKEREQAAQQKKSGRLTYKEEREFTTIEESIQTLETTLVQLNQALIQPEVSADPKKLVQLSNEIDDVQKKIEKAFNRWQELEAKKNG